MNAALDRDRLARVLGMLGSAHDGEVVAAARQAERLRADAGLTWNDIVIPRLPAPKRQNVASVADAIAFVLRHQTALTEWELSFAESIRQARYRLSEKQIEVLKRLVQKVQRAEMAA